MQTRIFKHDSLLVASGSYGKPVSINEQLAIGTWHLTSLGSMRKFGEKEGKEKAGVVLISAVQGLNTNCELRTAC
jgi:predicted ATP-grasp superfamily ATP-dependent carboligase